MNTHDDTDTVRRLLASHDPAPLSTLSDQDLRQVRSRVNAPHRRPMSWVAAAAAVLALTVGVLVPFARPPASWALDEVPDRGVRISVELPGFYQRGPDPAAVVAALREHGVAVDVVYGRDFTPWKAGRINGVGWEYPAPAPEGLSGALMDGPAALEDRDLRAYGMQFHPDGFSIFPDDFPGRVTIKIAVAPWQRLPSAQPASVS